ncbi:MAG TPA: HDOD domain-containing protein [Burkholderiaceae bacterium]|nr:HDOD domain-containing protein [Burkholderiaceae bacterium]
MNAPDAAFAPLESRPMQGSVLSQTVFTYAPVVDRSRNVVATRLCAMPAEGDALDVAHVTSALDEVWPSDALPVSLKVKGDVMAPNVAEAVPVGRVMLEIPASVACDPVNIDAIQGLYAVGGSLVLDGIPRPALPPEIVKCFARAIVPLAEDRRMKEGAQPPISGKRVIPFFEAGVHTIAEMEMCFERGADGIVGWPFDDALRTSAAKRTQPDLLNIVELIRMLDRGDDVAHIDAAIRRDASLAYRLLRYINSPAFGLAVEIQSFRHAVMILGYARLKRWLALLLATGSKEANLRPVMFASVRRGMFLERLVGAEQDESLRDELFICGVFSLLDKLFHTPFEELFATLSVPQAVYEALVQGEGPYRRYLDLMSAIEQGIANEVADITNECLLATEQVNRALLHALGDAARLG